MREYLLERLRGKKSCFVHFVLLVLDIHEKRTWKAVAFIFCLISFFAMQTHIDPFLEGLEILSILEELWSCRWCANTRWVCSISCNTRFSLRRVILSFMHSMLVNALRPKAEWLKTCWFGGDKPNVCNRTKVRRYWVVNKSIIFFIL